MIEVVVTRHPDAGTDVVVFVNGKRVSAGPDFLAVAVVDPGAGYSAPEWSDLRDEAATGLSPAAGDCVESAYGSYAGSSHTTLEND